MALKWKRINGLLFGSAEAAEFEGRPNTARACFPAMVSGAAREPIEAQSLKIRLFDFQLSIQLE